MASLLGTSGLRKPLTVNDTRLTTGIIEDITISGEFSTSSAPTTGDSLGNKTYIDSTADKSGFLVATDQTGTFTKATRTYEISPTGTSFKFVVRGTEVTKSAAENVVITDVEGLHYIYYTSGGTLTAIANPSHDQIEDIILNNIMVATLYWDATNSTEVIFSGDNEFHLSNMPASVHVYHHFKDGAFIDDGLALNTFSTDQDGSLDAHAQFGVDAGEIHDEDVNIDISAITSTTGVPVLYKDGASGDWRTDTQSGFSFLNAVAGRVYYNQFTGGAWQLTEVTNNRITMYHIYASNNDASNVLAIMGETEYTTAVAARNAAKEEINTITTAGLPGPEMHPIGTIIIQTNDSYTNAVKAKLLSDGDGNDWIDFRFQSLKAATASDHGNLAGLADDDHTQYVTLVNRTGETLDIDAIKTDSISESTGAAGITLNHKTIHDNLTASSLVYLNASKEMANTTLSSNITLTTGTLDTVQDIQTSSSPTFAALNLGGGTSLTEATYTFMAGIGNRIYLRPEGAGSANGQVVINDGSAVNFHGATGTLWAQFAHSTTTFKVDKIGEFTGAAGITFSQKTIHSNLSADTLPYLNASKELADATLSSNITLTTGTLDTVQDIQTGSSPTFAGLTIVNAINEFSIDGTLAGDSDSAVPTEKAVKTYVDAQVGGINYWDRTGTVLSPVTSGDDLNIDVIDEQTTNAGVTIEGILLKDGQIQETTLTMKNPASGNTTLYLEGNGTGNSELFVKRAGGSTTAVVNFSEDLTNRFRVGMAGSVNDFSIYNYFAAANAIEIGYTDNVVDIPTTLKCDTIKESTGSAGVTLSVADGYVKNPASGGTDLWVQGNTSGGAVLYLQREGTGNNSAVLHRTTSTNKWKVGMYDSLSKYQVFNYGLSTESMIIQADGGVLFPQVYADNVTTEIVYMNSAGQIGIDTSIQASKTNINTLTDASFIYSLTPKTFNRRKNTGRFEWSDSEYHSTLSHGLIAEDVQSVRPELCNYREMKAHVKDCPDSNKKTCCDSGCGCPTTTELSGVKYIRLIAPMIKCIKDQKNEIDSLKARCTSLESRIALLEGT
jgi:hypothetical protein